MGKLVDAFPLILESSRFLLHCAVAGLLPEGLAFACVRNATPLPITHSPVFPGLHEQQLARFGAVTAIGGVGDEKALLANVTAFWLWERMLRDPQRVRRAAEWGAEVGRQAAGGGGDGVDVARRVETGTEAGLMEIEAEEHTAWCTQQQLQPTALLSVARLLASVTAQLFRKNPRLLHQAVAAIADSGGGGNTEIVPGVAPEIALEGAPEIAHGGDPEMAGGARAPSRPLALDPWRGSDEVGLYARLGDEARRRRLRPLLRLLQPERAMPVPPAAVAGGEGVNGVTAVEAAPARGGTSRRIACSFFLRGSCKFGARCQNAHTADAERLICRHVSERGGCRYGAGCLYRHPGQEEDTGEDERVRAAAAAGLADPDLCICADDRGAGGGPGKAGRRAGADTGAATPGVHCSPQANYRGIVGGGVALMVEGEGVASPALGNVRTLRLVSPEEGGGGGGRNGGAGVVAGDLWRLHLPSSPAGVALSACPPCLVLWSRPTDACATAAGLRSLLLCLASKRLRSTPAAPLQLHLIGSAERVVVKAAALSGADDCFFSLIGVHAPPRDVGAAAVASGADAAITGGGATLCYAFSFNEPQWRDATALLPLLQHAPGAPLAPRWAALRISRLDASTDGSLAASLGTAGPAPAPATLQALASARVLAVDTESGGYAATLLQVAWVMMDGAGEVLDKYSALLQLPPSDREQVRVGRWGQGEMGDRVGRGRRGRAPEHMHCYPLFPPRPISFR